MQRDVVCHLYTFPFLSCFSETATRIFNDCRYNRHIVSWPCSPSESHQQHRTTRAHSNTIRTASHSHTASIKSYAIEDELIELHYGDERPDEGAKPESEGEVSAVRRAGATTETRDGVELEEFLLRYAYAARRGGTDDARA